MNTEPRFFALIFSRIVTANPDGTIPPDSIDLTGYVFTDERSQVLQRELVDAANAWARQRLQQTGEGV